MLAYGLDAEVPIEGVPEIMPVDAPIESPEGRPVADHEYGPVPPD